MSPSEPTRKLAALSDHETACLIGLGQGRRVLELGTYQGRTTFVLARHVAEIWTVDWHLGDEYMSNPDSLPAFAARLRGHPQRRKIVALVGSFEQVLPGLGDGRFDLVFWDGSKDAQALYRELRDICRVLHENGALALHDWPLWDTPTVAAHLRRPPDLVVDSLAVWYSAGDRSRT